MKSLVKMMNEDWIDIKKLFYILKKKQRWGFTTKYLNICLDTRVTDGTLHCTIKDRYGNPITLEDIDNERKSYE